MDDLEKTLRKIADDVIDDPAVRPKWLAIARQAFDLGRADAMAEIDAKFQLTERS